MSQTITASEAETEAAGIRLAESLRAGDVVLLYGDLGAGKTAFTRGLAQGLAIDAAERPELLAAVYRDADLKDKPRNVVGFAKDIPPPEMESLLLKSYGVDDEALRALANERSEIVKEWFTGKGGIAAERMFIVAPKLTADGIPDKGAPRRVDFAIR